MKMIGKPRPNETELIGQWIKDGDRVTGDETCHRINYLVEHYLKKIGFSEYGAWETLYQDPEDGRYWERIYPHGEWHGGGPPALINLSEDEAKKKYFHLFQ